MNSTPDPTPAAPAGEKPRFLPDVLAAIMAAVPDTAPYLEPIRQSALYSAPENMKMWWNGAAEALDANAAEHPQAEKIAAIFSGTRKEPHMTPQDGDRDADLCGLLAREVVSLVLSLEEAAWGPVEEKIIAHTRAAVERETAQLRAELATWKDSFSNAIEQAHNDVNKEKEAHAETLRMERQAHERIEKLEGTVAQLRARFVEQAVFALYESGRDSKGDPVVSVTWDGCCSESRDKDALRLILQKAFDIEHSFDPLRSVTALRAKLTAAEATVAQLRTRLSTAQDLLTRIKEYLEARKVNVGLVFLPELRAALAGGAR